MQQTVTTLPDSQWFNYTELDGPGQQQQAEEVCLTFNLFVRQCENGVMKKKHSRGLRANKVFRGKLIIREITTVQDEKTIDRGRLCRRDLHARTGTTKSKNTTKETTSQSLLPLYL